MKDNHIHKYMRVKMTPKFTVMKCMLPGCTHHVDKRLALNRLAICWRCDKNFVIDRRALKLERPHCSDCVKSNKKPRHDRLKELILTGDFKNII